MARFSLEFEETETLPAFPVATPAAAAQVATSAQAVVAGVRSQVTAQYNVSGPRAAIASLSAIVSSAAGSMKAALAPLVSTTQELAGLKRDTDALIHAADSLVRRPFDVLDGLTGALAALTSPATPTFIMGLLAAYGFLPTADRPAGSTATRIQDAVNWDVLLGVARTVPLVQAATLAPVASYDSYDAALAVRDAIAGAIDDLSDGAGDESFAALAQLRADLVQAVPGVESDLPRILRYTPPSTVPSLVLAHRLYGDLSREADLVTRNAIPRPGFILGGVELQVLSHA
jgi:hypothetical protein